MAPSDAHIVPYNAEADELSTVNNIVLNHNFLSKVDDVVIFVSAARSIYLHSDNEIKKNKIEKNLERKAKIKKMFGHCTT